MRFENEYFFKQFLGHAFFADLEPVDKKIRHQIVKTHPHLCNQYLDFITYIGIGEIKFGAIIIEPYNRSDEVEWMGMDSGANLLPLGTVCIAESGADWRYCMYVANDAAVYCQDFSAPVLEMQSESFFEFVTEIIFGPR